MGGNDSGQTSFPGASFKETHESKRKRPWRPPPPRHVPHPERDGVMRVPQTQQADLKGCPLWAPLMLHGCLVYRRGAGLITVLPVRMLKLSHLPRVSWLLTGEAGFAPNLTPVCAFASQNKGGLSGGRGGGFNTLLLNNIEPLCRKLGFSAHTLWTHVLIVTRSPTDCLHV